MSGTVRSHGLIALVLPWQGCTPQPSIQELVYCGTFLGACDKVLTIRGYVTTQDVIALLCLEKKGKDHEWLGLESDGRTSRFKVYVDSRLHWVMDKAQSEDHGFTGSVLNPCHYKVSSQWYLPVLSGTHQVGIWGHKR